METSLLLLRPKSQKRKSGVQAGHAKTSAKAMHSEQDYKEVAAVSSSRSLNWLKKLSQSGLSWKMLKDCSLLTKEQHLSTLSTRSKKSGIWGDGLRATSLILDCHNTENAYSLSPVISPIVHTNSILTAANCLGIIRRERRAGRGGKLDPIFRKSLFQTLRFWFSVGEVSGTPKQTTIAPRYVPKLEDIKAVIQTDQFYVARNLTWNECEKLMGFPEGWTVEEGDSLATPSPQLSSKKSGK